MLDSKQEIKENYYVSRFVSIAETYGVSGTYINWKAKGINTGGLFFVCGLNKKKVSPDNIDMIEIIENEEKTIGCVRTDARAFQINGQQPLMIHREIVNYCQQLDTLLNVYGYVGHPIPDSISPEMIELMQMTWRNFTDGKKTPAVRKDYEEMLYFCVKTVDDSNNVSFPEYKKMQYLKNGYYDTERSKLYNWYKKHFMKYKNEVSLAHLVNHAGRINFATVTYEHFRIVKKALTKRPDILYHFSNVRGDVLQVKDGEGYGSKEKNDRRYYTLHYPAVYTKDIENIFYEIDYPDEFGRSLQDIDPDGLGTEHVLIPNEYFQAFLDLCKEDGIKLCIDHTFIDTAFNGVPIAFSVAEHKRAMSLLNAFVSVYEKDILEKVPNFTRKQ